MIEKENIFDLLGNASGKYHSAILTSFSFDPVYFNNWYLPNLKKRGITNVIVVIEASNYDSMLEDYGKFGELLSHNDYTLIRQNAVGKGVFHSKIALIVGDNSGMLFVGSGNLTYSGQSVNEEVWGAVNLDTKSTHNYALFKSVWSYLRGLLPQDSDLINQQISWMSDYSSWVPELENIAEGICVSESGEQVSFIANTHGESILSQIYSVLDGVKVNSIEVVAPFYDSKGWLIQTLYEWFSPNKFTCWIYNQGTAPENYKELTHISFFGWAGCEYLKDNLHAKIYQFKTNNGTYLLLGSANATFNAWGKGSITNNDEAMLLVHNMDDYDYIKSLGINVKVSGSINVVKEQRSTSNADNLRLIILQRAEIINDILHLKIQPDDTSHLVRLLDNKANIIAEYTLNDKITISDEIRSSVCMAVITDGVKEISNRCLVIDEDTIIRTDPNPRGKKLSSLLNSSTKWDDNIAKILQFVSFETAADTTPKTIRISPRKKNVLPIKGGTDATDYDNVTLKGKSSILSMDNIRIADFLCSAFLNTKSKKNLESDESDQCVSEDELDTGNIMETSSVDNAAVKDAKERERSAIRRYLDKYIDQESEKLSEFEGKMYDAQDHSFPDYSLKIIESPSWNRSDGNLHDYSAALVAVALICNELSNQNISRNDAKDFMIKSIGKFLLLHGNGYPNTEDYAYIKKMRMHKDIALLSLLVFAQVTWSKNGQEDLMGKVFLLNLLASFNDDTTSLDEIYQNFKDKLAEDKFEIDHNSLFIINKAFDIYRKFISNGKSYYIASITYNLDCAIAWKTSIGFVLTYNYSKNMSNAMWKWQYSILPCGYLYEGEHFVVQRGEKLVMIEKY